MVRKKDLGGKPTATLQRYLLGVTFPATKEVLLDCARQNRAPQEVLSLLTDLPDDREFHGTADIIRHAGGRYAVY